MVIFHSDLDNTLIYSCRRDIGSRKICVEMYQGRQVSFMTKASYQMLEKVREKVRFVPTTTRTEGQYRRIRFGGKEPSYALVCNGGILLEHGTPSGPWYEESLNRIEESRRELEAAVNILKMDENRSLEVRFLNDLFVFTKSEAPGLTAGRLKEALDPDRVEVLLNGTKVYVMPKQLNKGTAVTRLKEYLGADEIIAAGDSEFDIPMLQEANRIYCPRELARKAGEKLRHAILPNEEEIFSDMLLDSILKSRR